MDPSNKGTQGDIQLKTGKLNTAPQMQEELLSSWLTRSAFLNGCDPLVLTGYLWPGWRAWSGDIDRGIPEEHQSALALASGINKDLLTQMSLAQVALSIKGKAPEKAATWPWILTVGARDRRRRGGLQYCPVCLWEDEQPHYRRYWRFAWHTVCEKHGGVLRDRCFHCGAPLEPHRLQAEVGGVAFCARCLESLALPACEKNDNRELLFIQKTGDKALIQGNISLFGDIVKANEWFSVLRLWVNTFRHGAVGQNDALMRFAKDRCPEFFEGDNRVVFETLPVGQRAPLLTATGHILALPLDKLVKILTVAGLSRQSVFHKGKPIIRPLARLYELLPDRGIQRRLQQPKKTAHDLPLPRSRRQVNLMMERLLRKAQQ